jgi:DNA repair protein RadA/Sms
MPKAQTRYVCQSCGHETPRWVGRCPECGEWNTLQEETPAPRVAARAAASRTKAAEAPVAITQVSSGGVARVSSGISELDRVLGGGIVPGSVVLVGGDPGIGKSTLLTQAAHNVAAASGEGCVLYISGEESLQQIRLRCERLGALAEGLLVANETDLGAIVAQVEATHPRLAVIDSIQTCNDATLESAPGTVSQIRDCAAALAAVAENGGPPVVLIGHVTKEGTLAGPRVLEHMVDTVLYFEGDRQSAYRILRAVKNRFGSSDEIGLFEMCEEGLAEVANPSAALLAQRMSDASGSAVAATVEGTRPLLVEVQALVSHSFLSSPRRTTTGVDYNRVNMLLAVLEKRVGLRLGDQDVFVNVAGGVRIVEPAVDLAVTMAVASNFREQPVDPSVVLIGEVGLGGEVRSVSRLDQRLREAARLGFTRAIVSRHSAHRGPATPGITVVPVANVLEAMHAALIPARE